MTNRTILDKTVSSIVIIGMPGAGKSTIGKLVAESLDWQLLDTDRLIELTTGKSLQKIVDEEGYLRLREIEQSVLSGVSLEEAVLATGGSAVYSVKNMERLLKESKVFFLDVPLEELAARVGDYSQRGVASSLSQSFQDIYKERVPLYLKYSHHTITCLGRDPSELCHEILDLWNS